MSGRLIISLDFELMWGVRDHRTTADYGDAVLGVRKALPELLALFKRHGVRATWATVGLLFARNRQEMLDHYPIIRPAYHHAQLSPYDAICSEIGNDEQSDPWHYGRSLVDQVLQADGQEMATHTYSHYYCLEEGQTIDAFEADLQAAIGIMGSAGVRPTSIVFPRNQMTDGHVQACVQHGISVYRGNPETYVYRARMKEDINPLVRGLRLIDASFPISGRLSYQTPTAQSGCTNVRSSRFFRPLSPRMGPMNDLHVKRIMDEMKVAAQAGEIYHLWCHPHNFGRHTGAQLRRLETILIAFRRLQDVYGMESLTMSEIAT
jgi:peptidoglycan/xylan/chitin deacetylase (PgdA/CDA1 family)